MEHAHSTHSRLRLRDASDAHVLFQAVRQGHFQLIRKRLTGPEQQSLHPGHVYVWADREGALERWTDGHCWSPSRVRGPFLMYDEMPSNETQDAFLRRKKSIGEKRTKQPRKKRLPALPGGLSKQTYSATLVEQGLPIQKWHLTAYFTEEASTQLHTVDEDPILSTIVVPPGIFVSSMSTRRKPKSSSKQRPDDGANDDSADSSGVNSPMTDYNGFTSLDGFGQGVLPSPSHFEVPSSSRIDYPWDSNNIQPKDEDEEGSGSGASAVTVTYPRSFDLQSPVHPFFNGDTGRTEKKFNPAVSGLPKYVASQQPSSGTAENWTVMPSLENSCPMDQRRHSLASTSSNSAYSMNPSSASTESSRTFTPSTHSSLSSPSTSWSPNPTFVDPPKVASTVPSSHYSSLGSWSAGKSLGVTAPQGQSYSSAPTVHSPLSNGPMTVHSTGPLPNHVSGMPPPTSLPPHLQEHPKVVPSAVPPTSTLPQISRRLSIPVMSSTSRSSPYSLPESATSASSILGSRPMSSYGTSQAQYGGAPASFPRPNPLSFTQEQQAFLKSQDYNSHSMPSSGHPAPSFAQSLMALTNSTDLHAPSFPRERSHTIPTTMNISRSHGWRQNSEGQEAGRTSGASHPQESFRNSNSVHGWVSQQSNNTSAQYPMQTQFDRIPPPPPGEVFESIIPPSSVANRNGATVRSHFQWNGELE